MRKHKPSPRYYEFPEARPRDMNGCPITLPEEAERDRIKQETIHRENLPFLGPVAGHDEEEEIER